MLVALAIAEWSLVYALRLTSVGLPAKLFWSKLRYLGIVGVPTAWLIFVLQYNNWEKRLKPSIIVMLALEPLAILALTWSNEAHHLIWSDIQLNFVGSLQVWNASHGIAYWGHAVYTYLLLLFSLFSLLQTFIRSPRLYRRQFGVLLLGALAPLVSNVLSVYHLVPFLLDLTPFAFAITSITAAWSIFRFRLFDIVPVARSAIVDNMKDGVIVLDSKNRILDLNPSALEIIGGSASKAIGHPIAQVLVDKPELLDLCIGKPKEQVEFTSGTGEAQRNYDLSITLLQDRYSNIEGRLVILHEITERKQIELTLKAQKKLSESLVAMARAAAKHPSLKSTLQNVLDMSAALTEAENGSIFLLDGEKVVTHSILARGKTKSVKQRDIVNKVMDEGLAGWVVQHRQPALISDTHQDDRWVMLPDAPYPVRSAMAVPIVSGSAVLGVLTLMHSDPNHFSDQHNYLIQSAANQIMLGLRNAQMYDEQRRLANHQTTLYKTLQTVGGHLDPEAIAHAAMESIARLTSWPAISILLPDEKGSHLDVKAVAGSLSVAERESIPIEQSITGQAFRTSQTQYAPDVSVDPDCVEPQPAHRSELAVPMRRGERVLGVLEATSDQLNAFNNDDTLLAKSLAEAIALALDNARLYAETNRYTEVIAEERSRLQALIQSSRDGIILIGMDQKLLVINAPVIDFLGLPGSPDDWIASPILKALYVIRHHAPDAVRAILGEMRRVRAGDSTAGEGEYEAPPRIIHWLNLPVERDETMLGRLIVLHDVTEERLVEKMRDDLIYTMVHDLRNPLTAISGALDILDNRIAADTLSDHQQLWGIARANTKRMVKLVNAILDINRLENQQMPLEHTLVPLDNLIAGVLDSQALLASDKDLRLESKIQPALPPVWADAKLIERVLHNLVDNAIKFTPSGGEVRVTASADTAERSRILVSVSDTGAGIPSEIQDRLFQKFITGQQEERGSGLGLAFCRMVMKAHSEEIWAENISDAGARFTFTLSPHSQLES